MILDLHELSSDCELETDICIIGGGAAGIAIALALKDCGLDVCLLEGGGLEEEPDGQALYAGEAVGFPMAADIGRYRGLGGTTSRWSGRCAPLSAIDFEERAWISGSGWPITRDALASFYSRAWEICGVRDVVRPDAEVLAELGADRIAIDPAKLEPFIWRFPARTDLPRQHLGRAFAGELRQSRTIRVVLHANHCGFEASEQGGHVSKADFKSLTGIAGSVRAKAFVLCAGGLENARILLNSAWTVPGGLGNQHDLVGRYFMQHLRGDTATVSASPAQAIMLQDAWNFFPSRTSTRYDVGFSLPDATQRSAKLLNASAILVYEAESDSAWVAGKQVMQVLRARKPTRETLRAVGALAREPRTAALGMWRRFVLGRMPRLASGVIRVNLDLEQAPNPESRVTLTNDVDALGLRRLRVDWRVSPLEGETARQMTKAIGSELQRLKLGAIRMAPSLAEEGVPANTLVRTHHHIGTTRMARDHRHGVVDPDCRVYGTANLFVAGSSVFPTGGHANPTLTIVALAVRLAGHLRDTLTPSMRAIPRSGPIVGAASKPAE